MKPGMPLECAHRFTSLMEKEILSIPSTGSTRMPLTVRNRPAANATIMTKSPAGTIFGREKGKMFHRNLKKDIHG